MVDLIPLYSTRYSTGRYRCRHRGTAVLNLVPGYTVPVQLRLSERDLGMDLGTKFRWVRRVGVAAKFRNHVKLVRTKFTRHNGRQPAYLAPLSLLRRKRYGLLVARRRQTRARSAVSET